MEMPRAARIEHAGAIYHVMNRGNHLEAIFKDEKDREVFLNTLEESCKASGWMIHSFVLMKNLDWTANWQGLWTEKKMEDFE